MGGLAGRRDVLSETERHCVFLRIEKLQIELPRPSRQTRRLWASWRSCWAASSARFAAGDSWTVPEGASHTYVILEPFTAVEATSPPAEAQGRDKQP